MVGRQQQDCRGRDRQSGAITDGTAADKTRMALDGTGRDSHHGKRSDKKLCRRIGVVVAGQLQQNGHIWDQDGRRRNGRKPESRRQDSRGWDGKRQPVSYDYDSDLVLVDAKGTLTEQMDTAKVDAAQMCQDHRGRRSHIRTGAAQMAAAGASRKSDCSRSGGDRNDLNTSGYSGSGSIIGQTQ